MAEAEWSALEDVLHESLDGFVVLDRGVQLDGAPSLSGVRRADLAGVNRTGQLVLVHVLPRRDELLEAAVDLLSTVRERAGVLARHLSDARIDLAREPLAALVVDGAEPAGVAALRALRARELRLFERVRVQSGRATSAWIMPVDLQAGSAKAAISPLLEWIERIDSAHRPLVDRALEGLSRLDPELSLEVVRDEVLGSFRQHELARLRWDGARVVLALPDARECVDLAQPADVERALDRVLRAHLAHLVTDEPLPGNEWSSRRDEPMEYTAAAEEVTAPVPAAFTPAPQLSADELAMLQA